MHPDGEIIVGIDVGTTKVATVVGLKRSGEVEVIGLGLSTSEGLRKGTVVNVEKTVESIRTSVREAEQSAGVNIKSAIVSLSGEHIKSFDSHAVEQVKNPQEVVEEDIYRVLEKAKSVELPHGREILHVLTQEFIVDENEGIKDPRGMTGYRLEAKVHIITNAIQSAENLIRCVEKGGISVEDTVFSGLASAEAVVTPEEKE
ncbi:MAG: cell division protein FtsA, partial [Deltaproteobacteria bacterium]